MKNILLVIDHLGPGGAQGQFSSLASELSTGDANVHVFTYKNICSSYDDILNGSNIKIHHYNSSLGFNYGVISAIKKLIKMHEISCIISFLDTPSYYCFLSILFNFSITFIPCKRSSSSHIKKTLIKKILDFTLYSRADYIVSNTINETTYLSNKYKILCNKFVTIYNGYNIPDLYHCKKPKSHKLIVLARVTESKNAESLIEAVYLLKNKYGINIQIDWYGRVDSVNYKCYLDELIKTKKLQLNFSFRGHVSNVNSLYPFYDGLILVSKYEGLPNVVCEAMLNYVPVISTPVSDVASFFKNNQDLYNGILIGGFSSESIAKAISQFYKMSDQDVYDMSLRAFEFSCAAFNMKKMIDSYKFIMEKINE